MRKTFSKSVITWGIQTTVWKEVGPMRQEGRNLPLKPATFALVPIVFIGGSYYGHHATVLTALTIDIVWNLVRPHKFRLFAVEADLSNKSSFPA